VAFGVGMNNSLAHFGWETSDNLRDYPKTRKKDKRRTMCSGGVGLGTRKEEICLFPISA
jgi:hypothetical protein